MTFRRAFCIASRSQISRKKTGHLIEPLNLPLAPFLPKTSLVKRKHAKTLIIFSYFIKAAKEDLFFANDAAASARLLFSNFIMLSTLLCLVKFN
jgi:hypothetical protein